MTQLISTGKAQIKAFQRFSNGYTVTNASQSLSQRQLATECVDLTENEPKITPIKSIRQSPNRLDTDDTLFDAVDVDALVAKYRQKQAGDSSKDVKNWKPCEIPKEKPQVIYTNDTPTNDDIWRQIQSVRERLRAAREACDDASLYGPISPKLAQNRIDLENELKVLGQRFRQQPTPIPNATPQALPPTPTPTKTNVIQRDTNESYCPTSQKPNVRAKMLQAKGILRDIFGHTSFRPNQERVIYEAFEKRDIFVLMPTGGGKSLCYQLPACVDDGLTVVISPLVSLIQDQVQQLEALDVGVAYLNGEQDYDTVQRPIVSELFSNQNRIKLLYVTPEKIASSGVLGKLFESLENRQKLARFVIDEAHCISQWGHDFRRDYMNLGHLRRQFPSVRVSLFSSSYSFRIKVRIMALTATANNQTEADIVRNLQLENPFITRSSFNRYASFYTTNDMFFHRHVAPI